MELSKQELDLEGKSKLIELALSALAKSVALGDGPFGFFELATLLEQVKRLNDAKDIYKQFLEELKDWSFKGDETSRLLQEEFQRKVTIAEQKVR